MSKRATYPPAPFVFMDLRSTYVMPEEEMLLGHRLLAGIVLFARNYESPQQLAQLIAQIRTINPALLLAVDHEGGRVQRFKTDFTVLPSMQKLGNLYLLNQEQGIRLTRDCGWLAGSELAAFGIQINFAPVLDLDLGRNDVIADRAFSGLSHVVTALGRAYLEGIRGAHVLPVAKHFPGHGGVSLDSHVDQPIDERSLEDLWQNDMRPFRDLVSEIPALMVSHVIYSQVSPMPAGYCLYWLNHILRQRMQSTALVFSDCLSMKAAQVAGDVVTRVCLAYQSGCNYVLLCNHFEDSQWDVLEAVEDELASYPAVAASATYHAFSPHVQSASESLARWDELQSSERYKQIVRELKNVE